MTASQTASTLTKSDLDALTRSYITPEIAKAAGLECVDTHEGAATVGRLNKKNAPRCNCAGIRIPYRLPESDVVRDWRLRRDNPEVDSNGKEINKYLSPPGKGNLFYFTPSAKKAWLQDVKVSAVFVEGEKKALALQRFFDECGAQVLVIGLPGVWNWRGTVGKTTNGNNARVAVKGVIADFGLIEWKKREVEIVFDADAKTNPQVVRAQRALAKELTGRGAGVRILEMPDLSVTGQKGIDDLLGAKGADFVSAWLTQARQDADDAGQVVGKYIATSEGFKWNKPIDGGSVPVLLCNFVAEITGDVCEDDGTEVKRNYEITARLANESVEHVGIVPCTSFASLGWRDELLGARAIIHPGRERHVECAIREHSYSIETRNIIAHTGWRLNPDGWHYYHGGGKVGATGNRPADVKLPPQLTPFVLPDVPTGKSASATTEAILRLFNVAPDKYSIPLTGAAFAAMLGKCDFSVDLFGYTGSGKTALALLIQSFFGAGFADAAHIPASWSSTANANEGLAHVAKDAVLLVDDFCPAGSATEVARQHANADRLKRAQGNISGRGRMRADGSLRPPKPPRGLIVSTGEDLPRGQSLRARSLILEVSQSVVNWDAVTQSQRDARNGLFAQATSAFLQWMAINDRIAIIQSEQHEKHQIAYWRDLWLNKLEAAHKRSATTLAYLSRAWHLWMESAVATQAMTEAEAKTLWKRIWKALDEAGQAQATYQASENPAIRFWELLQSAFSSGKAFLDPIDGTQIELSGFGWRGGQPQGDRIGWIGKKEILLIPDAAFTAAQRAGDGLSVTPSTLWKRLKEAGNLTAIEDERTTIRKRIDGKDHRVLSVKPEIFA